MTIGKIIIVALFVICVSCGKNTSDLAGTSTEPTPSPQEVKAAIAANPTPFLNEDKNNSYSIQSAPTPSLSSISSAAASHLQYFGYFLSNLTLPEVITTDSPAPTGHYRLGDNVDYGLELAGNTNTAYVSASVDMQSQLQHAKDNHQMVVLDVSGIFFYDGRLPNPTLALIKDYTYLEQRFQSFWSESIAGKYDDIIKVIYPIDEPYHLFVNSFWPWDKAAQKKNLANHLFKIGTIIKTVAPNVNLAITFDPPTANDQDCKIPSNFDWAGFYCYDDTANCYSYTSWLFFKTHRSLADLNHAVKGKRTSLSQKQYVITGAFSRLDAADISVAARNQRIVDAYTLAASDPDVVMFMPFLWRSYAEGTKLYRGVREIPKMRHLLNTIAGQIMAGAPPNEADLQVDL